ncbi:glycosyltransferase 87 family protein [Gordonia amicalis]|uniref:8-oxo-dGTP diphosphatase n=1 Tax=Gordonia amicalis TaxID=89053 RepID=A0ABU4D950_9ACTN|nr:glycosyltransferase 87 family protein [Gordonia amicalis]MDV6306252.1 glycosyltransferase 87 family protein [Gordonia amicalis]MDV7098988.1 glycosyltransferase 87 family protein [Gordonia amicalis]
MRSRSVLATALLAASIIARLVWDTLTVNGRNFVDLHVYRDGSAGLADGSLYLFTYSGETDFALPFTYPPFAAVVLYPLSLIPWDIVAIGWQLATFAALYACVVLALRLCGRSTDVHALAALWTAPAIWCEPVRVTLDYGQINVFLMLGTLMAISWARRADGTPSERGVLAGGALIGLMAGIKLTPAISGLWYLAVRKPSGALSAAFAFVLTVLGCLLLFPEVTRTYYGTLFGDAERIGPVQAVINQSLRGTLSRFVGFDVGTGWIWFLGVLVATVVAVFTWRSVSDALGVLLVVQFFGLLISPISWVHHWVWVVPLGVWLVHGAGARRPGARAILGMWVVVAGLGIPWILRVLIEYGPEPQAAVEAVFGAAWSIATFVTMGWLIATRAARGAHRTDDRPQDVVAAAIVDDGRVLLAQRAHPAELAGKWELPGGRVESGETHATALTREIREELGAEIEVAGRIGAEVTHPNGLMLYAYRARLRSGTPAALEHLDMQWFSADELRRLDLDDVVPADRDWIPELCAVLDDARVGEAG